MVVEAIAGNAFGIAGLDSGLLGIIFIVLGVVMFAIGGYVFFMAGRTGPGTKAIAFLGVAGVVLVAVGLWLPSAYPATNALTPPPPSATLSVTSSATFPAGETWNAQTGTLVADLVWNYSTNAFCVSATNQSCHGLPGYVDLPLTLARSDSNTQTFGFSVCWSSLQEYSTVTNPTSYSFPGYKAASGSNPGQWQWQFTAGSYKNSNPTAAAPATTSNIQCTTVGIGNFSSVNIAFHGPLAGNNGTLAPLSGTTPTLFSATTIAQFATYTTTLTVQNGSPSTITIQFVVIGQHSS